MLELVAEIFEGEVFFTEFALELDCGFFVDGLLGALEASNVPAGPIYTIGEAFADPQIIARQMRLDLPARPPRARALGQRI